MIWPESGIQLYGDYCNADVLGVTSEGVSTGTQSNSRMLSRMGNHAMSMPSPQFTHPRPTSSSATDFANGSTSKS